MRVLPQEGRSADNDIHTVHTGLDGDTRVIHVASDVGENLGALEAELADGLAVCARLGRGGGRGELNVLDSEFVKPVRLAYALSVPQVA